MYVFLEIGLYLWQQAQPKMAAVVRAAYLWEWLDYQMLPVACQLMVVAQAVMPAAVYSSLQAEALIEIVAVLLW